MLNISLSMQRLRGCGPSGWLAVACGSVAIATAISGGGGGTHAQAFTDVASAAGITHVQSTTASIAGLNGTSFMTGGVAAGDYDNDGRTDLIFTRLGLPDIFYRNQGDGTFESRTTTAGFASATYTNGVVSGDVDNDGDLDLYFTGASGEVRNYLYLNNGAGVFTDAGTGATAALANGVPRNGQGSTFGDVNNDGYLDLLTGDWGNPVASSQSRLLINRGTAAPGVFDDVTAAAGLDVYRKPTAYRFSPRIVDLDRDGHPDITFAADFQTSQLFWNNGDGTFTDGTLPAGVGTDFNGMGTAFADYDADGDLDWFITNITEDPEHPGGFGGGNRLYQNNGDRTFTDVTQEAGVFDSRWSWGTSFFEADNDGDIDLIATNGYTGAGWSQDRTFLWGNEDGVYTDISDAAGITDTQQGRGLAHLDYDGDGDLDVVIVNNQGAAILYRNNTTEDGGTNSYLRLHTEGTASNRDGIGAFITVTADLGDPETRQVWEIDGGTSFLSQNEHTAHFGLGDLAGGDGVVDLVTIQWPSGLVQHLHEITANQTLTVLEVDEPIALGDLDFTGNLDARDIDWLRVAISDPSLYNAVFGVAAADAADLNGDTEVNALDVDYFIADVMMLGLGDVNLDGFVSQADLDAVLLNWGDTDAVEGVSWSGGDLTGDGFVSQADLDLVLLNWGNGTLPNVNAIPEPTAAGILLGLLAMATRRNRR